MGDGAHLKNDFYQYPFILGGHSTAMNAQRQNIPKPHTFDHQSHRTLSHRATDSAPADIRNDADIRKKELADQTIVRLHRSDPRIRTLPHWSEKFYFSVKHAKRELEAGRRLPPGGVVCKSSRLTKIEGKSVYFLIRSKDTDRRRPASVDTPDLRRKGSELSSEARGRRSTHVSVVRLHRDDPRIQLLPHWSDKFSNSVKLATRVVDAGLRLPVDGVICKSDRLTTIEGKDVFFCLSPSKNNRVQPGSTSSDGQLHDLSARHPAEAPASPALRPDRMEHEKYSPHEKYIPSTPETEKMSPNNPTNSSNETDLLDFPVEVTRATFIEC